MSQIFKIRKRGTDTYSTGGMSPGFHKEGKSWSSLGRLKSHLSMFKGYQQNYKLPNVYQDCDIVIFNIVESQSFDMDQFIQQNTKKKR